MTAKEQMDQVMDKIISYFNNDRPIPYELIIEHKLFHDMVNVQDGIIDDYDFEQLFSDHLERDHQEPKCLKCNDTTLIETKVAGIFRRCLCELKSNQLNK